MALKYVTLNDTTGKRDEESAITSSGGVGDADKIVGTGPDGKIDPSLLPDQSKTTRVASEALDAGDLVNFFDDGGTPSVRKASATSAATSADGFVLNNVASGANADVFVTGTIGGLTGLTTGQTLFLSTTSGEIATAPASGSDEIWQEVGYAISDTEACIVIQDFICRA